MTRQTLFLILAVCSWELSCKAEYTHSNGMITLKGRLENVCRDVKGDGNFCPRTEPSRCRCNSDSNRLTVDCSFLTKKLQDIPSSFPTNTTHIRLEGNSIKEIKGNAFYGCFLLEYVNLYLNAIHRIAPNAFINIPKLAVISLDRNKLDLTNSHYVPSSVFDPVSKSLKALILTRNHEKIEPHYKPFFRYELLENLNKLTYLRIDRLGSESPLSKLCENMVNLNHFGFDNFLGFVREETLRNLSMCTFQFFDILGGLFFQDSVIDIEPMAFSHFQNLTHLDLSFNQFLGLRNVSKIWRGLESTKIMSLNLTKINTFVNRNSTFYLGKEFFNQNLCRLNRTLTRLHLAYNDIIAIDTNISQCLPNLEYLNLKCNRLLVADSLRFDIGRLKNLQTVDISQQSMVSYYYPDDGYNPRVNGGQMILETKTSLGNYMERGYPEQSSNWTVWPLYCPSGLKTVNLSFSINVVYRSLPYLNISGNCSSLERVEFSSNIIPHISDNKINFHGVPPVSLTLLLSDNLMSKFKLKVRTHRQHNIPKIVHLDLSMNKLGAYIEKQVNEFSGPLFTDLRYLNLADNQIKALSREEFIALPKLNFLILRSNSLTEFNLDLSHMVNLTHLDLRYNMIAMLDANARLMLDTISDNNPDGPLVVIYSENPIACNCGALSFLEWLLTQEMNDIMLPVWRTSMCSFQAKTISMDNLRSEILPSLVIRCQSKTWVIATSTVFVGMLCILGVSVCLYRHRWEIRFCCLKLARGSRKYHLLTASSNYKYDAFVAYAFEDRQWVLYEMAPRLENLGPEPLRLYLYEREALVGTRIEENIVEGMTKSRKIILILSRSFIKSRWCDYEVEMARVRSFDEGRDLIVPIILNDEEINASEISNSSLEMILRRYVFLTWPRHPEQQPQLVAEFWADLAAALRVGERSLLRCECGNVVTQTATTDLIAG